MKELFLIKDSLTNKISYYHLLLLLFSLPFDMFYSHIILISFAIHTLLNLKKEKLRSVFKTKVFMLQSVFFVTLIGVVYTSNKNEAYTELGRQLLILLIPVLFSLTSLDLKKYRSPLLLGFSLCCTATIAYLYFNAFHVMGFYKLPLKALFTHAFTNHNFSNPIGMHATFFSLQVSIALVYLLVFLLKKNTRAKQVFYAICSLILLAGLVQLCSKSVFVALLIAINFAIPFFILKGRRRIVFISSSIVVTLLIVLIISGSTSFRERYFTDLEKDLSQNLPDETIDPRLVRWDVALQIIGQAPVVGHGAGSEIPLLKESYFAHKLYNSYLNGLNAHNEYLSFLLKSGILGLIIYLLTLAYGFKKAVSKNDIMLFTFMLLIAIVSLSENVLDVDKGTIFYGLFFSFFVFSKDVKKIPETNNYLLSAATKYLV